MKKSYRSPSDGRRGAQSAAARPIQARCKMQRIHSARIGILAFFGLFAGQAAAGDWTNADTARQAAYLTLHAADWGQTRNIAKRPDEFYEVNPILGEHPSIRRVDSYMAFSALAHTAISYALPPKWRRRWQYASITVKAGIVGWNYSAGLKIDF